MTRKKTRPGDDEKKTRPGDDYKKESPAMTGATGGAQSVTLCHRGRVAPAGFVTSIVL